MPDAVIRNDGAVDLRAERSGVGNGRVYAVYFTATDDSGEACDGMVFVCVPQNRKADCIRDEVQYDATGCHAAKGSMPEPLTEQVATRVAGDQVSILFTTVKEGPVDVVIFDLRGRLVRRLAAQDFPAGQHALQWDGEAVQTAVRRIDQRVVFGLRIG